MRARNKNIHAGHGSNALERYVPNLRALSPVRGVFFRFWKHTKRIAENMTDSRRKGCRPLALPSSSFSLAMKRLHNPAPMFAGKLQEGSLKKNSPAGSASDNEAMKSRGQRTGPKVRRVHSSCAAGPARICERALAGPNLRQPVGSPQVVRAERFWAGS